jgi:hypothetical protein
LTQFGTVTATFGSNNVELPAYSTSGTSVVCPGEKAEFGPLANRMIVHEQGNVGDCLHFCNGGGGHFPPWTRKQSYRHNSANPRSRPMPQH